MLELPFKYVLSGTLVMNTYEVQQDHPCFKNIQKALELASSHVPFVAALVPYESDGNNVGSGTDYRLTDVLDDSVGEYNFILSVHNVYDNGLFTCKVCHMTSGPYVEFSMGDDGTYAKSKTTFYKW